jgi:soluble lytic murein transglycosylase-like protein
MLRKVAEFEVAAISGFAAVGAAVVHMADKAASADLNYQLLALHMFTSVPVARELSLALNTLGATLEDTMYNKELSQAFDRLIKLQEAVQLPADFEDNMKKIRELHREFATLGMFIEKYFLPMLTNSLVRIFGGDMDTLLAKVKGWTDYLIKHMPEIADTFADYLAPILDTMKEMFAALWDDAKEFANLFTNIVGMLTGDDSIQGATTDWEQFGRAVQEAAIAIGGAATDLLKVASNAMKLAHVLILAGKYLPNVFGQALYGAGGAAGAAGAAAAQAAASGELKEMQDIMNSLQPVGDTTPPLPHAPSGTSQLLAPKVAPTGEKLTTEQQQVAAAVLRQAKVMGIDPKLALAIAFHESSYQEFGKGKFAGPGGAYTNPEATAEGEHAMGVFQLLPSTVAGLEKKHGKKYDPADMASNIEGGLTLLKDLMGQYPGDIRAAVAHYEGKGGKDSYRNADQIIESSVRIGTINIHTSADPKAVKDATTEGVIKAAEQLRTQRRLAEFGNDQWNMAGVG